VGGQLQGYLEAEGVAFTGVPATTAETTSDKLRLTEVCARLRLFACVC
jgi:hypothetical protein